MDRQEIYSQSQVRSYDFAWAQRQALIGIGQLAFDLIGSSGTFVGGQGLVASPSMPASLTIGLSAGDLYALADIDATAYGPLSSDTNQTTQQGFAAAQSVTLSTSGLGSGQSRWALIWAEFSQTDEIPGDDPTGGLLNYLNTADPAGPPYSGPNDDNTPQNTRRLGVCTIGVTYGAVATTGSETPPSAPGGSVGLYLIDLTFGQTTITSGEILVAGPNVGSNVGSTYPQAPFLSGLIGAGQYCLDVGAANAYVAGLINSPPAGTPIRVKIGASNTNTGASTLNGTTIINPDGSALVQGQLRGNGIYEFISDGTHYQLVSWGRAAALSDNYYGTHGTYSLAVPSWAAHADIDVWGAGAGAMGSNQGSPGNVGASGSAGGQASSRGVAVTPGGTMTVVVGQGGGGTTGSSGTQAGNGGTSTVSGGGLGSAISATGGTGGGSGPGAGGVGSGGTMNLQGQAGTDLDGASTAGGTCEAAWGGNAPNGGLGGNGSATLAATGPGGGGGANYIQNQGQSGADGGVRVVFYP